MKRIGFSASEEMSFENVDGRTTDTFIYYKLTYEPSAQMSLKGPVTVSLQRPRHWYGASMVFYRIPTEFLLAILCALTTLSLRSQHMHCGYGVLKTMDFSKTQ